MAGVHDKVAAADDSRVGGDEGSAKLHGHMEHIEEVREGAEDGDNDAETRVGLETTRAPNGGKEEVERIYEESEQAGDKEDSVPIGNDVAVGIQDLVPP